MKNKGVHKVFCGEKEENEQQKENDKTCPKKEATSKTIE
jgi:hypothetical protein